MKLWLNTPCPGVPPVIDSRKADAPRKLSKHLPIHIGGSTLHSSHQLWFYRGLVFCRTCGFYAAHKAQKLKLPCGLGYESLPSPRGYDNIQRILSDKLPRALAAWPDTFSTRVPQPLLHLS